MESWQVVKAALDRVGAKLVASRMGLSQSLVYRWAQPTAGAPDEPGGSGVRNPLDRLADLVELTGERELVHWLCQRAGGFFVPNPLADADIDLAVLHQTREMIKDFSDVLEAVSDALSNDQFIDKAEADRIRGEWEKLKRLGESFAVCCEQGCYNRRRAK